MRSFPTAAHEQLIASQEAVDDLKRGASDIAQDLTGWLPHARIKDGWNRSQPACREMGSVKLPPSNRGDRTPVELFVEGIRAWKPGVRVLLAVKR